MKVTHPFIPIYDSFSKILILGSFPSVKSREQDFYYAHSKNRFWRVISSICNEKLPETKEEKVNLLLKNNIAIWDVIESCTVKASSDSSIKDVKINNFDKILTESNIQKILFNGGTAYKFFNRYYNGNLKNIECIKLPSTSPANARFTLDKLVEIWGKYI